MELLLFGGLWKLRTYTFVRVICRSEVEAANPAAVNLYKKFGFEAKENPNKLSKNVYMIKYI